MNRHFNDAAYYVRRAATATFHGLQEELEPAIEEAKFRYYDYRGIEPPEEPTRIEQIQAELDELEERAEGEAREAIQTARERITTIRSGE